MKNPPNWYDVYSQGTKEGEEELKIFTALARNSKWTWRSISAIAKETGIEKARVEEILYKYYKKGIVFQNPKNEDQWGYWQNVPEMLGRGKKSILDEDLENRMNSAAFRQLSSNNIVF